MALLIAFIVAMVITMALVPLLARWASVLGLVDNPGGRRVHAAPIPKIGGIAMGVGALLSILINVSNGVLPYHSYLVAAGVILAFGVWDDRVELRPWVKLLGQLLAICIVVFAGGVSIDHFTLVDTYAVPAWIGTPLTMLFILGVTNAINLSDGLDGLAGGTTLLSAAALALLARLSGDVTVAIATMAMAGAILGFLRYNTYPARIFMGDAGSQFLGFSVATFAVMLTQRESTSLSAALPLMLFGLPVVDTLMVMTQRLRERQPIFQGDKRHIHHKLLALGFDHYEAVLVIYAGHLTFFVFAWLMRFQPDLNVLLAFTVLSGGMVSALLLAGRAGWRWRRPDVRATGRSRLGRLVLWLAHPDRLPRWALLGVALGVIVYMAIVAVDAKPSSDVGVLAASLAVPALILTVAPHDRGQWLARLILSVAFTMSVYLDHQSPDTSATLHILKLTVLPLVAIGVVLRMRLSERRFDLTPLDLLLIGISLVVPNLPGIAGPGNLGFSIIKLVVMLYAVELCIDQGSRTKRLVVVATLVFLAAMALLAFR